MNIKKLLGDRLIVELDNLEEKTSSGLIISKTPDHGDAIYGTVKAVGPGRRTERGELIPMESTVGDRVLFRYGKQIYIDGQPYVEVVESDVVLIK